jgi:hypothetical protein
MRSHDIELLIDGLPSTDSLRSWRLSVDLLPMPSRSAIRVRMPTPALRSGRRQRLDCRDRHGDASDGSGGGGRLRATIPLSPTKTGKALLPVDGRVKARAQTNW